MMARETIEGAIRCALGNDLAIPVGEDLFMTQQHALKTLMLMLKHSRVTVLIRSAMMGTLMTSMDVITCTREKKELSA